MVALREKQLATMSGPCEPMSLCPSRVESHWTHARFAMNWFARLAALPCPALPWPHAARSVGRREREREREGWIDIQINRQIYSVVLPCCCGHSVLVAAAPGAEGGRKNIRCPNPSGITKRTFDAAQKVTQGSKGAREQAGRGRKVGRRCRGGANCRERGAQSLTQSLKPSEADGIIAGPTRSSHE